MSSEGPLPPSGALLEYIVYIYIYIHVHPVGPSPMHPMHRIFATRRCDVSEAAMGESGQKASCSPLHVQDMFVSFDF